MWPRFGQGCPPEVVLNLTEVGPNCADLGPKWKFLVECGIWPHAGPIWHGFCRYLHKVRQLLLDAGQLWQIVAQLCATYHPMFVESGQTLHELEQVWPKADPDFRTWPQTCNNWPKCFNSLSNPHELGQNMANAGNTLEDCGDNRPNSSQHNRGIRCPARAA